MNILFAWDYPLDPESGGVERVTSVLMGGLSRRGHKCFSIQYNGRSPIVDQDGFSFSSLKEYLDNHPIDVLINQNGYSDYLSREIERLEWKGRYIICFHSSPEMSKINYSWEKTFGKLISVKIPLGERFKFLVKVLIFPLWHARTMRVIKQMYYKNYSICTHFVLLSSFFKDDFILFSGIRDFHKLFAINNPLSFPDTANEEILKKKEKMVIIVARLFDEEKRISTALEIWRMIQKRGYGDWTLRIVGAGPDEKKLKARARSMKLENVVFSGKENPLPSYDRAAILMVTSRYEGWGLALTEAQQRGVVPVAMDSYKSLHDIVEHGVNGIIVPDGDIEGAAAEMMSLMDDDNVRFCMGKAGLKNVGRFELPVILDQWENLISISK